MTRNRELFYRVAEAIEKQPDRHYQPEWATALDENGNEMASTSSKEKTTGCTTAFCVAGWSLHLEGIFDLIWTRGSSFWESTYTDGKVIWTRSSPNFWETTYTDGNGVHLGPHDIRDAAEAKLGLTPDEANTLFDGRWVPKGDLSVPDALRMIGDGADVSAVSDR